MASINILVAVFTALAINSATSLTVESPPCSGSLSNCDDCYSPAIGLRYGLKKIYMNGATYGAFSVGSNGNIILLDNANSPVNGYSYVPSPVTLTEGSPFIAPFWDDINLRCPSNIADGNRVRYAETCDSRVLDDVYGVTCYIDSSFRADVAVVITYDHVQRYPCPSDRKSNTFQAVIATDFSSCKTFLIISFGGMEWNLRTPTVGYGSGLCTGNQTQSLPLSCLANQQFTYGVQDRFSTSVQEMNKGSLVSSLQNAEIVYSQQGKDDGKVAEHEGKLILQNFDEEEKLQRELKMALQEFGNKA